MLLSLARSNRYRGAMTALLERSLFLTPGPKANVTAIRHDPQVDPEHRVQPA